MRFILTPDGALASVQASHKIPFGLIWPLLEDDGRRLQVKVGSRFASVAYSDQADEQNFIVVNKQAKITNDEKAVQSTYGWLRPVRVTVAGAVNETFVYPRNAAEPTAAAVQRSFVRTASGFRSLLGRVDGNLYIGRTSAGGEGRIIDLNHDGKADVTFSEKCQFILRHEHGKVQAIETDRPVSALMQGIQIKLTAYKPVYLP
jgi:hypothetical protein